MHRDNPSVFGFRTYVTDAIKEWELLFEERCKDVPEHENEHNPHPEADEGRAKVLKELQEEYLVSFEGWYTEEVVVFAYSAYPRKVLLCITEAGAYSRFLDVIHKDWKPTFLQWAHFLWLFSGKACELFADLLYLLPDSQKPMDNNRKLQISKSQVDEGLIGKALFSDMLKKGYYTERTCPYLIGAFLDYPDECTFAREHFEILSKLSSRLTPVEAGLAFRSTVLYRAHRWHDCPCGYKRGEDACGCAKNYILQGFKGKNKGEELEDDPYKEYACVIFKLMLEKHHVDAVDMKERWSQEQRDQFLRSACDIVFCQPVYVEIYQNLHNGRKPALQQEFPRTLTERERSSNATRSVDQNYNHSMAQHGGCVRRNCKQAMKAKCANVCCKTHCVEAYKDCRVHRSYHPKRDKEGKEKIRIPPENNKRKSIRYTPMHLYQKDRPRLISRGDDI